MFAVGFCRYHLILDGKDEAISLRIEIYTGQPSERGAFI